MMIERLYVKLQTELGPGNAAVGRLLQHFDGIRGLFSATPSQVRSVYQSKKVAALFDGDFTRTDEILNVCKENGIKIICFEQSGYPERLRNIPDPPALLYCRGELPNIDDNIAIAVVGPRKPDEYGVKAAFSLSARLARGGAVVVSGGALGVDTEAHGGALFAGGKTVAVLGCGLLYPYLQCNAALRDEIALQGAVVSEFPPDTGAFRANFPMRNRIMSGLSVGTVVVQASAKSGALITARHAADQGRDVFVIPGTPGDKLYAGSNLLLKDGAKPVLSVVDILEEYVESYPHRLLLDRLYSKDEPDIAKGFREFHKTETTKIRNEEEAEVQMPRVAPVLSINDCSEDARSVFAAMADGADSPDTISEITDFDTTRVIVALTELEIGGYVVAAPGGRYKISE